MQILKINNNHFEVECISTQLTIGSHGTISLTVNTLRHPNYYSYFTDIFDRYNDEVFNQLPKSDTIFNVQCKNIKGYGCSLKSMDIDNTNHLMHLSINCNYLEEITVQEKRDELIDDVLNKTSSDKNNIKKNPNNNL